MYCSHGNRSTTNCFSKDFAMFLLHTRSKEKVVNFILQQKNFKGGSKIIFPTPQTITMLKIFSISTVNFPFKVVIYTVKPVL